MSNKVSPGGKDDRCVGLKNLPPACANYLEVEASTSCSLKGLSRPVQELLYI
jgi:hypothetical protein